MPPETDRTALADRLERWRYQLLNERCTEWVADDQRLADALDLASARIARWPPRPRVAPAGPSERPPRRRPVWQAALAWLDPATDLEELSVRAADATAARFGPQAPGGAGGGRRMLLYAPIYLSSYCVNHCVYCGFHYAKGHPAAAPRARTKRWRRPRCSWAAGSGTISLLAGEFPRLTRRTTSSRSSGGWSPWACGRRSRLPRRRRRPTPRWSPPGLRRDALPGDLRPASATPGITPAAPKRRYDWRLEGLDRAADAGMGRLGLGILLGLADPRAETAWRMMRHADYLRAPFPGPHLGVQPAADPRGARGISAAVRGRRRDVRPALLRVASGVSGGGTGPVDAGAGVAAEPAGAGSASRSSAPAVARPRAATPKARPTPNSRSTTRGASPKSPPGSSARGSSRRGTCRSQGCRGEGPGCAAITRTTGR